MDEQTFKRLLNEALDPIKERLDDPETGLKRINKRMDILWDQVVKITTDMEGVNEKLDAHSRSLKRIESKFELSEDDIKKLDKRVKTTEASLGISPPPELTIP